jgi:hypothetical protein
MESKSEGILDPLNQLAFVEKIHMGKNPSKFVCESFESNKPSIFQRTLINHSFLKGHLT